MRTVKGTVRGMAVDLEESLPEGTTVEVVVRDGGEGPFFAQDFDGALGAELEEELRAAHAPAAPAADPDELDEALRQVEW